MTTPEKESPPPDEIDRLEQLRQQTKDEAEAWQNLLENLRKMRTKHTDNAENQKPSA